MLNIVPNIINKLYSLMHNWGGHSKLAILFLHLISLIFQYYFFLYWFSPKKISIFVLGFNKFVWYCHLGELPEWQI